MASAAWPIPQRRCSRPGSQPRARSRRAICRSWSKILRKLVRKPPPASRSQPSRAGFVSLIRFELLQRLVQAFLKLGCDLVARDAFGGKIACHLVEDLVHRLVLQMVRHQRRRVAGCGIAAKAELGCGAEPEQLVGPGRGLEHELLVVDEFGLKALLALVERGHGQLHFVFADRDRTGWKRTSPCSNQDHLKLPAEARRRQACWAAPTKCVQVGVRRTRASSTPASSARQRCLLLVKQTQRRMARRTSRADA